MPKGVKVTLPASAACVLFALLLYVDVHPWLRGGFGWRWFHQPAPAARTLLLAGLVAGYVAGGYALLRWTRREVWALLWALVGSVALALGVIYLKHDNLGYELFVRTVSMVATGQHHAAANLDLDLPTLRGWAAQMADFDPDNETISRHVLLAPPGIPLFYEGLNGLLGQFPALAERLQLSVLLYQCQNYALLAYSAAEWASAWFGMLMPLWAALTVFPVYGVARQLDIPAREAALWWALVPMPAAFAGSWNTLYPLLVISAFAVFLRGLRRDGPAWVALSGGMVGLLTFMNFAPVPVLGVFGVYTLLHYFVPGAADRTTDEVVLVPAGGGVVLRRSVITGAVFGAGLALPWVIWMSVGGDAPWALLTASFGTHFSLDRPYAPWVFLHTYDWLLFAGLPLALVSLALLRRPVDGASKLAWALWLSVLVVAVSGTARGETARVWSFFTPFVAVAAAGVIRDNRGAWVALTASHAAMFLALTPTWVVFGAEEMTPPQQEYYALAPSQPAGVTFNDEMRLNAWQVNTYPDNNQLTLWLGWQAHRRMTDAYWFSALLVSADGVPTGESVVWQGQDTRYPTTCWRPGERVIDPVVIPYPADVLSGDYWLSLAAFPDGQPDNRLPVTLPDGSQDTQIGLGPVTLP